mmetsp:Transcript_7532/g.22032  ORF Transcript_7532/g.22032 Transcript_7532/m.22032 type:complete len:226 (-) Transcript_7532:41-718(-)
MDRDCPTGIVGSLQEKTAAEDEYNICSPERHLQEENDEDLKRADFPDERAKSDHASASGEERVHEEEDVQFDEAHVCARVCVLEGSKNEDGLQDDKHRSDVIEAHRGEGVSFEEGHEEAEADEYHDAYVDEQLIVVGVVWRIRVVDEKSEEDHEDDANNREHGAEGLHVPHRFGEHVCRRCGVHHVIVREIRSPIRGVFRRMAHVLRHVFIRGWFDEHWQGVIHR